jgi:hypothetical protein
VGVYHVVRFLVPRVKRQANSLLLDARSAPFWTMVGLNVGFFSTFATH